MALIPKLLSSKHAELSMKLSRMDSPSTGGSVTGMLIKSSTSSKSVKNIIFINPLSAKTNTA